MVERASGAFASAAALFVFDEELRILSWNEGAEQLTGVPAAEAVGRGCWEVIAGRDDEGGIVCHRGCSRARLVREGHCLPAVVLNARTGERRRRLALETIAARSEAGMLFLHVMHEAPLEAAVEAAAGRELRPRLTPRQREILSLLAEGVPVKGVARQLGLMETTVRNHVRMLFRALGVHSQLEAVACARRFELI